MAGVVCSFVTHQRIMKLITIAKLVPATLLMVSFVRRWSVVSTQRSTSSQIYAWYLLVPLMLEKVLPRVHQQQRQSSLSTVLLLPSLFSLFFSLAQTTVLLACYFPVFAHNMALLTRQWACFSFSQPSAI